MTATTEHKQDQGQDLAPAEEIKSAGALISALTKTAKAFTIYLPNNPVIRDFIAELGRKVLTHLADYGTVQFDVQQFALTVRGTPVYQNQDQRESLAFRLYSDGILALIFSEGIDEQEIHDFAEVLGKNRPSDIDDDLVTLLWLKKLPHISWILSDDYAALDVELGTEHAGKSTQKRLSAIVQDLNEEKQTAPGPVSQSKPASAIKPPAAPIPREIIFLSAEEEALLARERAEEEKRNPFAAVMGILSTILLTEKDPELFSEFVTLTVNLVVDLLHTEEIEAALHLCRLLKKISLNETLPETTRQQLITAIEQTMSRNMLKNLITIIDTSDRLSPQDLRDILLYFGQKSIGPLCELLAAVQKMKMRKVIIDVLVEIGKDSPPAFFPFLHDQRWYLLRNIILILRTIGDFSQLDEVITLASHHDRRVRKEALLYLEAAPEPRAKAAVIPLLADDTSALRIRALQCLAESRCSGALEQVTQIVQSRDFEGKEYTEKMAFYDVLGVLGGNNMLPLFRKMLLKTSWFMKQKDKEAIRFAVAGLCRINSPEALELVKTAYAQKNSDIKVIIDEERKRYSPKSPPGRGDMP